MAENIDLNINIGANVTDLQAQLQKSENLLKQFEAALKKATNIGEINYLNGQIKNLNTSIAGINTQMNKVGRPTADATNALNNVSRVAQDASYGFIGIANNLNPLLESFQQLQKKTGSSTEALKSMAAGLAGAGGIGLAIGVASSLLVTYSKEIAEFFNGPQEKLKAFREELKKLNQDIYKIVGEAQSNRTVGLNLVNVISGGNPTQQQEALKRLKSLYSDNAAIKAATIKTDKAYLVHLVNVASKQEEFAGKEKNTQDVLDAAYARRAKLEKERQDALDAVSPTTSGSAAYNKKKTEEERARVSRGYDAEFAKIDIDIANAKKKNLELINALTDIPTPTNTNTPKSTQDSDAVKYAKQELKKIEDYIVKVKARLKESEFVLKNESIKLFELPSERTKKEDPRRAYFEKQAKDLLEESKKGGFGTYMEGLFKKDKNKLDEEEGERKRIEALTQSYYQFAQTISGTVTNALFDMYDAIQKGENPLEVIGQMFANIAKQIAAVVIQALILQALMEAFPALKGAFAAVGLISDAAGKGRALNAVGNAVQPSSSFNANGMTGNSVSSNGQFVLKGNDLVLALQRSNSTLNLIR